MRDTERHAIATNKLEGLTGIRGIAALWVVLLHGSMLHAMAPAVGKGQGPLWTFASKGWLGVDMFFVLSGFIISYVYQAKMTRPTWPQLKQFWLARIARIYPLHLVTMLAIGSAALIATQFANYQLQHPSLFSLDKAVASLFLVQSWAPGLRGYNYVSWSVSAEWFAYMLFPLFTVAIFRIQSRLVNLALIAGAFGLMMLSYGGLPIEDDLSPLLRVGGEFLVGCLMFNIYRATKSHRIFDHLVWLSFAAMIALCAVPRPLISDFAVIAVTAFLVFSLALAPRAGGRLFSSKLAVYLGKISYALYLVHGVTFPAFDGISRRLFPKPSLAVGIALFLGLVGFSLLLAHLAWRFVEEPGRELIRRWAARRDERQKAAGALANGRSRWLPAFRSSLGAILLVGLSSGAIYGAKRYQRSAAYARQAKVSVLTTKAGAPLQPPHDQSDSVRD